MVYTTQPGTVRPILDSIGTHPAEPSMDFSGLPDFSLLQAARDIYRTYYEVHPDQLNRPIGVAIDPMTLRGHLIFTRKPILLPQECFVPIAQLDSELQ